MSLSSQAQNRAPAPREDDELIAELLQQARAALTKSSGRSADEAATDSTLQRELREHCRVMAVTAGEVSESFRNWATHVPWEQITALRGGDASLVPLLSDVFLGKTSNINIRFAAAVALFFNLFMVVVAYVAIAWTVPKDDAAVRRTPEIVPAKS